MPVFGALLSFLFLGEGIAPFHVVGALFVFSGIGLMSRRPVRDG
jgi:drug/metabolite transporter (DMT)-like permease